MKLMKTAGKLALLMLFVAFSSCKKDKNNDGKADKFDIDSTQISAFFEKHPDFKEHEKDIRSLYRKYDYRFVWYDEDGRNDFAEILYDRASQISKEGIQTDLPYKQEFADLFSDDRKKPDIKKELLISSMYFFYAKKVYEGIDPQRSKELGWYLPRERVSYVDYLEELMQDSDKIVKDTAEMIGPYYNLRKALRHYRDVRNKGGWATITLPEGSKILKKGDIGPAVVQLRNRLFLGGDLKVNSGSDVFDDALVSAVKAYQMKQNLDVDGKVSASMIKDLNVPVESRIKTIIVNMERCRWISPDMQKAEEYIAVNIPSYRLRYFRDGKPALESNVVVGKELNKTVVFSGKMSYLVFSPYWNVPKSIVEKEIKPALEEDPSYMEKHNMEWTENGLVRQRPGGDNSLGLVKFMFPNQNNIYLHDTPAKSLFNREDRAFSHGCVRVEKARDLAVMILDDDKNWNAEKIDTAMHSGVEKQYPLKRKIPVYIAYFTAWADETGNVAFFDDVYKRDDRLANLLYRE
ncbi:MAG TPA: L,D-transpeptidase family protein [Flavobacterium sp.]|jgi:murein L,D-transpeptidase YcbB/YkuD